MKRQRDGDAAAAAAPSPYAEPMEARAAQTVEFLRSLKLSIPIPTMQAVTDRRPCSKCGKLRRYYCYDCMTVVHPETHPPLLTLPLSVHVVLHSNEHRSKATTLPASIVSPQVSIHEYPNVPELDPATTVVLYPSEHAVSLSALDISTVKQVVFIDSTWQQSKAISKDPRVTGFRHVKIEKKESLFWRFQDKDPSYLATVEAIYYFVREVVALRNGGYSGEVDDLLAYYANQYVTVQKNYTSQSFCRRHFTDYVLKGVDWNRVFD